MQAFFNQRMPTAFLVRRSLQVFQMHVNTQSGVVKKAELDEIEATKGTKHFTA